ncbi:1,4-alpha-glucan branching protein GlgB [Oceanibaculum pacificum]|uniref:1,4-alpha-glucan branching enzyme GlgB n=1 Tax=Oceanibaculum pacificum TaxID=580166 RepID=A0A154WGZ5_9PROT|nr:1,4-alpha-glucan branching protein GlgB [Oceanibaculum pacificum]KZD12749.1 glycogen-branching enzyme [Oceanibaculum pacificum]
MSAAQGWRLDDTAVTALMQARHPDPFAILGPHRTERGIALRVIRPGAETAEAFDPTTGAPLASLLRRHEGGFFEGLLPEETPYRLRFTAGPADWQEEDVYRFPSRFGDLDRHLLAEGRHRRLYERLGAHPTLLDGVEGTHFAVWAPNATRVSVVGDFNDWDGRRHPMRRHPSIGVWDLFVPGVGEGALYKYELLGPNGEMLPLKADPVGFAAQMPPATASVVHGLPRYEWGDQAWMEARHERQDRTAPISIYEVHLGSWRRRADGGLMSYEEAADALIAYAGDLGFTHIELLPISEHPFTGSWGYQPIGLFAPTRRFGPPEGFAYLVDRCHQAGIGVIVDWVPAHFPSDAHGLARFDGTALYEHADPRQGLHRDWNTLIYNFGRREVANFLRANALFWLEQYHVDALRVDAVASMLYLDYSREAGEWVPNAQGGRENLDAVEFLRMLNVELYGDHPGAISIAEESTAWPGVSQPVGADGHSGGLGFGYKWNMGWMHDTLDYVGRDPIHRQHHHDQLTFGLIYAFSENFILPLSHDEVVHGKGSLIGRMPGDQWQKFANLRAYFGFMWTHPGKKLLFMGGEFAQPHEWNHDLPLDWHLLADPFHAGMRDLIRTLNHLYRGEPALHALDCQPEGFAWIDAADAQSSIFIYQRNGRPGDPPVVVVCNFTPTVRRDYRIGLPQGGRWVERLNTDDGVYGGSGVGNGALTAEPTPWHGRPHSVALTLPPLATLVLAPER